jgi:hypothetical protein
VGRSFAASALRLLLAKLRRIDVLVIDDRAMAPLTEPERRDFWEICEDRHGPVGNLNVAASGRVLA